MIKVENLIYQYPNGQRVLNNLNFTINKGDFTAIIGQNGSGKTTLLKHFNGLLKATKGSVTVKELDVSKNKTSLTARHIGFLFQNPDHQIFCSSVYDEIAFGLKNTGVSPNKVNDLVQDAAKKVKIIPFLQANPFTLSKGQRQRVALASIIAMNTDILVLDEPTTGQDYQEGLEIMEIIKKMHNDGKTVIIVSHDMELIAKYAKRVVILLNGEVIADGSVQEILSKTEVLAKSKLQPPQIYQLASKFNKAGLFHNVYSVEEMFKQILLYKEKENVYNG